MMKPHQKFPQTKHSPTQCYFSSGPVSILLAAYFGSDFLSSRHIDFYNSYIC